MVFDVYCEDSGELRQIEAESASAAAERFHRDDDDGSGNSGTYRVCDDGEWQRYTVKLRYVIECDVRSKGACDAPETGE